MYVLYTYVYTYVCIVSVVHGTYIIIVLYRTVIPCVFVNRYEGETFLLLSFAGSEIHQ